MTAAPATSVASVMPMSLNFSASALHNMLISRAAATAMPDTVSPPKDRLKRKRASFDDKDGDDDIKKRGRPRVEPQVESAADRRRTQIRLAQRAYRQRKESTLDELRKQVSDLQRTIHSMNQSFQDLSRTIVSQDDPDPSRLINGLKRLSNQYATLLENTQDSNQTSPPSATENERAPSAVNLLPENSFEDSVISTKRAPQKEQPVFLKSESVPTTQVWGYSLDPVQDQTNQYNNNNSNNGSNSIVELSSSHLAGSGQFQSPLRTQSLTPPFSYSYQETTFARRLHRASLELAYRLACDSSRNPAKAAKIFQIWFKWVPSIKDVRNQLHTCLTKGIHEPLSLWHFPLSHVGGAGTHYGRQEVKGAWKARPSSNEWSVRLAQAPTLSMDATPTECYDSQSAMLNVINMNPDLHGEWLDAYDVEGYLAEKGISLDPQVSIVDIEMPISEVIESEKAEMKRSGGSISTQSSVSGLSSSSSSNNSSSSSNNSSSSSVPTVASLGTSAPPTTIYTSSPPPDFQYNPNFVNYGMNYSTAVGYSDTTNGSYMSYNQSQLSQPYIPQRVLATAGEYNCMGGPTGVNMPDYMPEGMYVPVPMPAPIPQSKVVTIDVAKLIITIARSAMCLGRTPGYRRHNVDNALRDSILHDFD